MATDRRRGILFLTFGAFFTVTFLVGGGVVTATNGGYWTLVFFTAYLLGLGVLGPVIYKSASKSQCDSRALNTRSSARLHRFLIAIPFPFFFILSLAFFRSTAFATELGSHLFMTTMGVGLSLFVPLGLGTMHRSGEQSGEPEPPITPVLKS